MKHIVDRILLRLSTVAPRRGAWVETGNPEDESDTSYVAPRRGAWVETPVRIAVKCIIWSRTPQGCVG